MTVDLFAMRALKIGTKNGERIVCRWLGPGGQRVSREACSRRGGVFRRQGLQGLPVHRSQARRSGEDTPSRGAHDMVVKATGLLLPQRQKLTIRVQPAVSRWGGLGVGVSKCWGLLCGMFVALALRTSEGPRLTKMEWRFVYRTAFETRRRSSRLLGWSERS